jgi:competence protein ComEC
LFWDFAGSAISVLITFLGLLAEWQGERTPLAVPSRLHLAAAMLGALVLMLPRGLSLRWCGLFLLLPLVLPVSGRLRPGELELLVLDVGQGTSILVATQEETLLYDTGPGDGRGRSLVPSVIAPALRGVGEDTLARVVISHADLDHAGGAGALLNRFPNAVYLASHPDNPGVGCTVHATWKSADFYFQALHPSGHLPYLGNSSSCVVSVRGGDASVLLAGDISEAIEERLLMEGLDSHTVLLVPHHGSLTSSSAEFIDRLQPEVAIATASLGNRFGFPKAEVRQRYRERGARFWSTGECGAIRMHMQADGSWVASSARRQRMRAWRWPAAADCP